MPRLPFAHALATGVLADAIQGTRSKGEILSWVVKTAPDGKSFTDALFKEAVELSEIAEVPVANESAFQLLRSEGSSQSINRLKSLPGKYPALWTNRESEHRRDPCVSQYAWSFEDCVQCLARTDVPLLRLVHAAKAYWTDPSLAGNSEFIRRLEDFLTQCVDTKTLWRQRQRGRAEIMLEQVETARE